jgi:gliding motility-associated-like protein
MKKIILSFFFTLTLLGIQITISGQPVVNFTLPDTSCVGTQINITNQTTGGTTFYWNFCSGNANITPVGTNIGNPGNSLLEPTYITLVQDSTDCFSFTSDQGNPTHITRYYHGSSFRNNPISWTNLVTGTTSWEVEGIQIKKDNGNWYGFENYNTTIHRLDFGPSLWNISPAVTDLGITAPVSVAHGLIIIKEGNIWLGFFDSDTQNKLYRLNFGNSLTTIPTLEDLGNVGGFSHPGQLVIQQENGLWYILVTNLNSSSISRITFGNSLLNTPSGSNLGNLGGVQSPVGLTYIQDCETSSGYFTVYQSQGSLGKLNFTGGIGGSITAQILGNIGNLSYPHSFSEIFRQNDSLFAYITNWQNSTLTQLSFPPCNNASIPSSNQFTPPLFSYNQPGTYNVRLQVDEGLPDQVSLCKPIVIVPPPVEYLGPDRSICPGKTTTLDAGPGFATYFWSTNATTRTIMVSTAGTYWVTVTQNGCTASDTVNVSLYPSPIPTIAGPIYPCIGSTGNVYSTETGMFNYIWNVSAGGTITAGGASTSNTMTVTWNNTGTQNVLVNYADTNACEALSPSILIINVEPLPVPTISGPDSTCIFTTNNNYITDPGMTSYVWTVSSGGTITSGLGTNSITVTWNSIGQQYVSVLYTDQNGCTAYGPTLYPVTVNPLPGTPGNITGPSLICIGSQGLVYTVSPITDAISYVWTLPLGFSIVSGNGTNTITVDVDTNASSGTIQVYATNICGDGQPSPPFPIIVNTLPTGNAGPDGLTCQMIPFTITQASALNYSAVQWSSNGTGILTGSTTLSPTYTPAQGEIGPVTLTLIIYGNAPCGNDTSMMVIDIETKATVNAGSDLVTCGQYPILITGSSASDYQSLLWTTNGSGVFNDPAILHPTYTPGTSDINAGSVFLTLHATSSEPCEPDSGRVLLTIGRPVYVNAGPDTSVCQDHLFTINKAIASGYGKIRWTTTGDGTFNDSTIVTPIYTPGNGDILQGKSILIITAEGIYPCSSETDSLILTINRKPSVHPGPDGAICQGMTFPVTGVSASDYDNFIWVHNGQGVLSGTTTLSPVYTPGPGETGTIIMTLSVFGNPSCPDSMVSCQMRLKIFTPVQVNAGEDQTISYDTVAIIHAEANGGSGDYRYEWHPSSLLQDDTARETQTLSLKNDTVFIVTVTDEVTGCSASDSIKIYVGLGEGLEGCIVIHNVITPNGDGLNDTWIIDCIENFPDNMVQIFNRWGERVNNYYHYDNKNQVWDGTNYNGELLPAGTYYYVLKIKNLKTWTGWVLLRCGLK